MISAVSRVELVTTGEFCILYQDLRIFLKYIQCFWQAHKNIQNYLYLPFLTKKLKRRRKREWFVGNYTLLRSTQRSDQRHSLSARRAGSEGRLGWAGEGLDIVISGNEVVRLADLRKTLCHHSTGMLWKLWNIRSIKSLASKQFQFLDRQAKQAVSSYLGIIQKILVCEFVCYHNSNRALGSIKQKRCFGQIC